MWVNVQNKNMSNERNSNIEDFDEYIRQGESDMKEKAYIWQTAIGLQAVDGLSTSEYLKETAIRNIVGEIIVDEPANAGQVQDKFGISTNELMDNEVKSA